MNFLNDTQLQKLNENDRTRQIKTEIFYLINSLILLLIFLNDLLEFIKNENDITLQIKNEKF